MTRPPSDNTRTSIHCSLLIYRLFKMSKEKVRNMQIAQYKAL